MFSSRKWKWLLLLPVCILIFATMGNSLVSGEIRRVALEQKKIELTNEINLIALSLEKDNEADAAIFEENLHTMVEYVDKLYQVFAATYKRASGEYKLLTGREATIVPFNPFDHPEFVEAVSTHDTGYVTVVFDPGEPEKARDLHLYYRLAPEHFDREDRYLIVGGVSHYSVTAGADALISIIPMVSTLIMFGLMMWAVLLITRLGYVYDLRIGPKWRDRKGDADD